MPVIRTKHNRENPFVQLNKEALWDKNLSLKAIGLWARCMSRPDDWEFCLTELEKSCKEKETALYSAIKELIDQRYLLKYQTHNSENGKFDKVTYLIFEFKLTEEEIKSYNEEFKIKSPLPGFPDAGFPDAENQGLPIKSSKEIDKYKESNQSTILEISPESKKVQSNDDGLIFLCKEMREIQQQLSDNGVKIEDKSFTYWSKKFPLHAIREAARLLTEAFLRDPSNITNCAGYITTLLKKPYVLNINNVRQNKELCKKKELDKCSCLVISDEWVTFPSLQKDVPFWYSTEQFKDQINQHLKTCQDNKTSLKAQDIDNRPSNMISEGIDKIIAALSPQMQICEEI